MSQKTNGHVLKNPSSNVDRYENLQFFEIKNVKTLSSGGFGRVDLVQIRNDPTRSFALKKVKKAALTQAHQRRHIMSEKQVLTEVDSPFIVKLFKTFKDSKYLYMFTEVCLGGDLWSVTKHKKHLNKNETQFYVACVLEAFEFLHARNIVYRDLKPENLLLDDKGYLKLCDFGFAKKLEEGCKTKTFCGTSHYIAPEVFLGCGHDVKADYWSLGVLIFELMTGKPPFEGNNSKDVGDAVLKGTNCIKFPKKLGKNTVDLFKKLCKKDPRERLGITETRQHQWLSDFDFASLVRRTLAAPFVPIVRHNKDTRNFKNCGPAPDDATPDDFSDWDATF